MLILDILQIPIEFIREQLTGWVLLIIVVFIIYFICLRKYYIHREKFYDIGSQVKSLEQVESAEDDIKLEYENNSTKISKQERERDGNRDIRDARKEYKQERKILKNSNMIDNQFNQNNSKTTSRNSKMNNTKGKKTKVLEGFASNILPMSTGSTVPSDTSMPPIATTIFDNLNLDDTQIQSCKANYNQVIAQLITDLGKLSDMASKNPYLNLKKQFDSIIAKAVDNIMNYLTLTIKSPRILTRTAIRTEVISTLNNTLENLIDKTNKDLTNAMNMLARMNSTTIDYNSQLSSINDSRAALEKYIATDKLINELGHNISVSQREISSILDKSYILPIYERNFDKISQLAKSDFNDNEGNLAMKYSKAYADFLEQEKKEELNINPLSLASRIESGIVNMLSSIGDSRDSRDSKKSSSAGIKTTADITGEYGDDWYVSNGELREQMTRDYGFTARDIRQVANNPIPKQERTGGLLDNTQLNRKNIFSDSSNRGSYMINPTTQAALLEGFADSSNTSPTITSPSIIKAFDDSNKLNKNKNSKNLENQTDIISKLLSGDFLQYMLDTINGYMTGGYIAYKDKLNNYLGGISGGITDGGFKLEDNMIPAGFALFILSMLFYFIDLTSS